VQPIAPVPSDTRAVTDFAIKGSQPAGFYAKAGSIDEADIELKAKGFKTFQVLKPFVYVDKHGEVWPVMPNVGEETTDLASVPPQLWGLVASYGRQLAPALMHDYYCALAKSQKSAAGRESLKVRAAYGVRRAADLRFREALRVKGVAWFRSNFFWAAVTFDRYRTFRPILAILVLLQVLAAAVGVVGAIGVWLFHAIRTSMWPDDQPLPRTTSVAGHPWFWLLVAAAGLATCVVYGWNSMLAIACGCVAAPVIAVELVVTLAMAAILYSIDLLIMGIGKAVTLGRADLSKPGFAPFRTDR
jgi:hypothetical protein